MTNPNPLPSVEGWPSDEGQQQAAIALFKSIAYNTPGHWSNEDRAKAFVLRYFNEIVPLFSPAPKREGWRWVPEEPTTEMKRALLVLRGYDPDADESTLDKLGRLDVATMGALLEVYRIMVLAAPPPPSVPVGGWRQWLIRQLRDERLSDREVASVVAFHPTIKDARDPPAPQSQEHE